MALITLKVKEEVEKKFTEQNPTNPRLAMEQSLERFAHISPDQRAVVLSNEARGRLERAFGFPIEDQNGFCGWIERLMSLNVEGAQIKLNAQQLKVITQQAAYAKQSLEDFIKARISQWLVSTLGV